MIGSATPMEAKSQNALPSGPGWWFEPKWDGFRCLAFREGPKVVLQAKSGKPLTRFFPEVAARLAAVKADRFVVDGELLISEGDRFSFEALQLRLHPAQSRIEHLASTTPAAFAMFDMLVDTDGKDLRTKPLADRHVALQRFHDGNGGPLLTLTPGTEDRDRAQAWLEGGKLEGVIAKALNGPYAEGERAMIKVKRQRTADCVVGGFRYASAGKIVGSLLLGLYDDKGRLDHVGFTSGLAGIDKADLTRRLESLAGGEGFTGDKPGGPSRWSTERSAEWTPLRPEMVVEVSYDHVSAGRFRHGTRLLRWRPDKAPQQCTKEQIR